jgi:hypothetical protein
MFQLGFNILGFNFSGQNFVREADGSVGIALTFIYALSFYVTKTVLVGPKWFWSDQIDLDLTMMIWSQPK